MQTNIFNIYFFPVFVLDISESKVGRKIVLLYKIIVIKVTTATGEKNPESTTA